MRNIRRKFQRPSARWDMNRIEEEKIILRDYGLRTKRELWRAQATLRDFRQRARNLNAVKNKADEKILLEKLVRLGILKEGKGLDDVLALTVSDVLNRRLQSIVHRKGIAKTPLQSRQLIVHRHVMVDGKVTTFPSYLIPSDLEGKISIIGGK
jgi:small subunit ribosomal protein S4